MNRESENLADRNPQEGIQEEITDMWEYHNILGERKMEAMKDDDEIGAAYFSGQQSGLVHAVEVLEGLQEDFDDE